MVFLWFSYGFPMVFQRPFYPRGLPIDPRRHLGGPCSAARDRAARHGGLAQVQSSGLRERAAGYGFKEGAFMVVYCIVFIYIYIYTQLSYIYLFIYIYIPYYSYIYIYIYVCVCMFFKYGLIVRY